MPGISGAIAKLREEGISGVARQLSIRSGWVPGTDRTPYRLIAAAALIAAVLIPYGAIDHGPVICPFRLVTGRPCPACGLTRSWIALMHGHLQDSFALNPFGPLTVIAAVLVVLGVHQRFPGFIKLINSRPVLYPGIAIVFAVWVVRLFTVRW